jgi:hypothetical protein
MPIVQPTCCNTMVYNEMHCLFSDIRIIQPTCATLITSFTYGEFKIPIMQLTCGARYGIRRCGDRPFLAQAPTCARSRRQPLPTIVKARGPLTTFAPEGEAPSEPALALGSPSRRRPRGSHRAEYMTHRGCIGDADQVWRPAVNLDERASSVENPTFDALCGLVRRPAVSQ